MKVKWITLENQWGTSSLKQHGFIATEESTRQYSNEKYIGNISLCGKVWADNGNEEISDFNDLEGEIKHPEACKLCLKYEPLAREKQD